jgi:PPK2 family polyphosphate:nucleotide phosphotransferase
VRDIPGRWRLMKTSEQLKAMVSKLRLDRAGTISLSDYDPGLLPSGDKKKIREEAEALLAHSVEELKAQQELLYASNSWSILILFQGMDTAGKDSIIRHVLSGLNPQGCDVTSFKHPSPKELDHTFLWRYSLELPGRGMIGVFNRSYFEEVLIVRVHPRIYEAQRIPAAASGDNIWKNRFEDINGFEQHLSRNGTKILKFFLHLSKDEQRERLLKRIDDPDKHWKFDISDISERENWDEYIQAYEKMLGATSTECAPWYVIPADHKWFSRTLVADILLNTMKGLNLKYPVVSAEQSAHLKTAKEVLRKGVDRK